VADRLRRELLEVVGVADAEVDDQDGGPAGIKVRLSPDADPTYVAAGVQRILAAHGISSQVAPAVARGGGPPPPPGAATVVSLADFDEEDGRRRGPSRRVPGVVLVGVAVEETPQGVAVVAQSSDGRSASRRARGTQDGLTEAVVAVVSELLGVDAPQIGAIEERELGGANVTTIVLEQVDGARVAGSAVVEGGVPFAVGKAVWSALAGNKQ
jgi:hypothetical protein